MYDLIDASLNPLCNECNYLDPDESCNLQVSNSHLVSLHLNIHSIPDKLDLLKNLICTLKANNIVVDVLLICETFITDLNKNKCKIDGYELFEEHRVNMTKGGVAIYVNKCLKFVERKDLNIFDEGI